MSKITELNEILLRFAGGQLVGSKKTEVTRYYDDETGLEISDKSSPAISVGLPLAEEVLGQIAGAAVAKTEADAITIADLTSERDQLTADLQAMTTDRDAQKAIADTVPGLQGQVTTLTSEKADLQTQLDTSASQVSTLTAEVERLTALIPVPLEPNWITPQEFLSRLQAAAPGILKRIWVSESEVAAEAAVMLFTWSGLIEITRGKLLEQMLQGLKAIDLITEEEIAKLFGEV